VVVAVAVVVVVAVAVAVAVAVVTLSVRSTTCLLLCVSSAIPNYNVGHRLLSRMGWKEGDSLGKANAGIREPVSYNSQ